MLARLSVSPDGDVEAPKKLIDAALAKGRTFDRIFGLAASTAAQATVDRLGLREARLV